MAKGGRRGRPRQSAAAKPSAEISENQAATSELEKPSSLLPEPDPVSTPGLTQEHSSTYALMVDPDASTPLKFIPTTKINGAKLAKLEPEDVNSEIEYWKQAVLCSVLGANPPLDVMMGFFKRIWPLMEIDKICLAKPGLYLVRFASIADH